MESLTLKQFMLRNKRTANREAERNGNITLLPKPTIRQASVFIVIQGVAGETRTHMALTHLCAVLTTSAPCLTWVGI